VPEVVWQWTVFGGLVALLLALDLLVFHRHDRSPSWREAAGWTAFWIGISLGFNGLVWWWRGPEPAVAFLGGYVLEKALSMDNVFVFAVIFRFFAVPLHYQYRVLYWGILGAVVLRLTFVLAGVQLIRHFDWVLPLFGLLLVYTAWKLATHTDEEIHPDKNIVLRTARRFFRVTPSDHHKYGHAFFVREAGRLCITPLFLVLLVIESSDFFSPANSFPAILGITIDPFIVFSSNVFAILGLRALYFLLAGAIETFRHLHYGLAAVLGFIGLNMIGDYFLVQPPAQHLVPTWIKLAVIALLLGVSILASVVAKRKQP
jgi:tellurite resistance protein TerC